MKADHQWSLLEAMPDSVLIVGRDGSILYANAKAEEMFGYAADEFASLTVEQLIPQDFKERHEDHRSKFFAARSHRTLGMGLRLKALCKDGTKIPVDISLRYSDASGVPVAIASVRDMSEREGLIQALEQSVSFNLTVLQSLREHIAVISKSGAILAVNGAWDQFTENNSLQSSSIIVEGGNYIDACRQGAQSGCEFADQAREGIESVLCRERSLFEMEYTDHSSDEERWFLMRVLALKGSEGGAVVSHSSITPQKSAEAELRRSLQEVQRLKDRLDAESAYLREEIKGLHNFEEIVGQSAPLCHAIHEVEQVAGTDANVLLTGETGTGKEVFARAIHNRSLRAGHPLVKVNCAALPSNLIESELFGHVKGAFTGALTDRVGRFELAHEGTLFLDEIGELDLELQTKLLRVLQEGEFEKVGAPGETIRVDVRVIAATNRDLKQAMDEGSFRSDLYFRLAVFPIALPALRERRDDIPMLAWFFISQKQARLGKNIEEIPDQAMDALVRYDWPGNVRELENVIERALILTRGARLLLDESTLNVFSNSPPDGNSTRLSDISRSHIIKVLEECGWRVKGTAGAAERLGMKPSTLRFRMKKLGIERPTDDKVAAPS